MEGFYSSFTCSSYQSRQSLPHLLYKVFFHGCDTYFATCIGKLLEQNRAASFLTLGMGRRKTIPYMDFKVITELPLVYIWIFSTHLIHRLTYPESVHSFRYLLPQMRTPNNTIFVCSCIYECTLSGYVSLCIHQRGGSSGLRGLCTQFYFVIFVSDLACQWYCIDWNVSNQCSAMPHYLRLTASSTGHFCNEDNISRC